MEYFHKLGVVLIFMVFLQFFHPTSTFTCYTECKKRRKVGCYGESKSDTI